MLWAWLPRGLISFVAQMAVRDLRGTRPAVASVAAAAALKRALDTEAAAARRQALAMRKGLDFTEVAGVASAPELRVAIKEAVRAAAAGGGMLQSGVLSTLRGFTQDARRSRRELRTAQQRRQQRPGARLAGRRKGGYMAPVRPPPVELGRALLCETRAQLSPAEALSRTGAALPPPAGQQWQTCAARGCGWPWCTIVYPSWPNHILS